MSDAPQAVLYRWRQEWGLPSLSIGCIQVEAYLRLAKVDFAVQDCASSSASPTGQVPCLDTAEDLVGADPASPVGDDLAAAKALLGYLKRKMTNLDRGLGASQRAELVAFSALVETKLQPALLYSTWCEPAAYASHTRAAYGGGLAFPLSYLLPRGQRKAVAKQFAGATASKIYGDAEEALDAIASRMAASTSSGFFFGNQPSSLDAILYGCLVYLKAAPVVHPELRRKMEGHRNLGAYVDRIAAEHFSSELPCVADAGVRWSQWEPAGAAGGRDERYSKQKSEKDVQMQRKARLWLAGAAAAIVAYVLFSGDYLEVTTYLGELGEEDGDGDAE